MSLPTLSPAETQAALQAGARLVDIRAKDEHARNRIEGAINLPLEQIGELPQDGRKVVFHCLSGMRTAGNAEALCAAAGDAPAFILDGGLNAWRAAGLAVKSDTSQPLEIMRQVQISAGLLVLIGVILGFTVAPAFFGLSAFVGAGLVFAGVSGWCGMAELLRIMPWNARKGA